MPTKRKASESTINNNDDNNQTKSTTKSNSNKKKSSTSSSSSSSSSKSSSSSTSSPQSRIEKLIQSMNSSIKKKKESKSNEEEEKVDKMMALYEEFSPFLVHFMGQKVERQGEWFDASVEQMVVILLRELNSESFEVQSAALSILMKLVNNLSLEKHKTKETLILNDLLFGRIVKALVHSTNLNEDLLEFFGGEYVAENDDVRYFLFINLRRICTEKLAERKKKGTKEEEEIEFSSRIYSFLKNMEVSDEIDKFFVGEPLKTEESERDKDSDDSDDDVPELDDAEEKKRKKRLAEITLENERNQEKMMKKMFGSSEEKKELKKEERLREQSKQKSKNSSSEDLKRRLSSPSFHKKASQGCWLNFLKLNMSPAQYKEILLNLERDVIPGFRTPAFLSDFLVDSFDQGGVISMLALSGLLILMTKHNLDYPDYYKKLYQILTVDSFSTKYKSRFFKLLDISLSSKYIPAYIAASFAKKLGRLALNAPPHGVTLCLVLIYNLILRNPSLKLLIDREPKAPVKQILLIGMKEENDPSKPLEECNGFDPYNIKELDLSKSNALESSLWELDILKNHYCPQISRLTKILETETKIPYNLNDFINESYDTVFAQNTNREPKVSPPFAFEKPNGLFGDNFGVWNLVA